MPVLNYLEALYPNDTLALEDLTRKLVTLLALASGQRQQTLAAIRISNIKVVSDAYLINISDRLKTSGVNRMQPTLRLPFFKDRPGVCVASVLEQYLKKTESIRTAEPDILIRTVRKPNLPATTDSIRRWIKSVLSRSGIDTSVFTLHSTRYAATSAAQRGGVSLEIIRSTAGWSASSTAFAEFYNRPVVEKNNFAEAVFASTTKRQ